MINTLVKHIIINHNYNNMFTFNTGYKLTPGFTELDIAIKDMIIVLLQDKSTLINNINTTVPIIWYDLNTPQFIKGVNIDHNMGNITIKLNLKELKKYIGNKFDLICKFQIMRPIIPYKKIIRKIINEI